MVTNKPSCPSTFPGALWNKQLLAGRILKEGFLDSMTCCPKHMASFMELFCRWYRDMVPSRDQ
jgi:hypothetical protein